MFDSSDEIWMRSAIALAKEAESKGEVPVGAILVFENRIVGLGRNQCIELRDPTAHAEIQALRSGAEFMGNYRLTGTKLYVTIEPCTMCAGALIHSRIDALIFGAREPRSGAIRSSINVLENTGLNHRLTVSEGILAMESSELLSSFFKKKRNRRC